MRQVGHDAYRKLKKVLVPGRTSASDGKFCRLRHRTIPPSICGFLGLKNKLSLQGLPGEVLTIYEGAREAEVNDQLSRKVGKFFRRPQQSVLKDERC